MYVVCFSVFYSSQGREKGRLFGCLVDRSIDRFIREEIRLFIMVDDADLPVNSLMFGILLLILDSNSSNIDDEEL